MQAPGGLQPCSGAGALPTPALVRGADATAHGPVTTCDCAQRDGGWTRGPRAACCPPRGSIRLTSDARGPHLLSPRGPLLLRPGVVLGTLCLARSPRPHQGRGSLAGKMAAPGARGGPSWGFPRAQRQPCQPQGKWHGRPAALVS